MHGVLVRGTHDVDVTAFDMETLRERRGEWAWLPVEPPFRIGGLVSVVACETDCVFPHALFKHRAAATSSIDDDPSSARPRRQDRARRPRHATLVRRRAARPADRAARDRAARGPWRGYSHAPDATSPRCARPASARCSRSAKRRDLRRRAARLARRGVPGRARRGRRRCVRRSHGSPRSCSSTDCSRRRRRDAARLADRRPAYRLRPGWRSRSARRRVDARRVRPAQPRGARVVARRSPAAWRSARPPRDRAPRALAAFAAREQPRACAAGYVRAGARVVPVTRRQRRVAVRHVVVDVVTVGPGARPLSTRAMPSVPPPTAAA